METIEFGKIVNTHGLKGEVKVYSYTDNEKKILKLKKVYIRG
jgi:16S rRNA processing protein RimM